RNLKPVPILQSQSVDLKTALDPHWAICTGNILSIYKSMEDAKKHNIQKVIYVGDEPGAKLLLDSFTWLKQKIILNRSHFAYLQDHEYQIIKNGL
ncbi:hypothetical protein, partial [Enterococcus faecium]|uniref:hypothetical protein n=1 Tax=Enterococcus faecium TaxID=1352 RepID=UPI0034E939CA